MANRSPHREYLRCPRARRRKYQRQLPCVMRIDTNRLSEARQPTPPVAVPRPAIMRKAPQDYPKSTAFILDSSAPRSRAGKLNRGRRRWLKCSTSAKEVLTKVPVLVVQHMPPTFTALLAEQR